MVAMCEATYTFLLLKQGINLGLARNESRRFINNCLGDMSQNNLTSASLLALLECSHFRKD